MTDKQIEKALKKQWKKTPREVISHIKTIIKLPISSTDARGRIWAFIEEWEEMTVKELIERRIFLKKQYLELLKREIEFIEKTIASMETEKDNLEKRPLQ